MDDTTIDADAPPDWEARSSELLCPLCKYNLRGLTSPRCPECGFAFTWRELIEAQTTRLSWLFEHGGKRIIRTFLMTYLSAALPRRFWGKISPAHTVHFWRLILYWVTVITLCGVVLSWPFGREVYRQARANHVAKASYILWPQKPWLFWPPGHSNVFPLPSSAFSPSSLAWVGPTWRYNELPVTAVQLDESYPLPWQTGFWHDFRINSQMYCTWWMGVLLVCWPVAVMVTLLIFAVSLRRAGIRPAQLLRTVIYCCPAGLILAGGLSWWAFVGAGDASNTYSGITEATPPGWLLLQASLLIVVIGTYRLAVAFRRYLRLHLPLATALATQIIVTLVLAALVVVIADFSRRV